MIDSQIPKYCYFRKKVHFQFIFSHSFIYYFKTWSNFAYQPNTDENGTPSTPFVIGTGTFLIQNSTQVVGVIAPFPYTPQFSLNIYQGVGLTWPSGINITHPELQSWNQTPALHSGWAIKISNATTSGIGGSGWIQPF